MRVITFFALLILTTSGYAQHPKGDKTQDDVYYDGGDSRDPKSGKLIPKKTYKILVKNELTADENFKLVGQTLTSNDFVVDVKDKEYRTIKTFPLSMDNTTRGLRLVFIIRDHEISVSGEATLATLSQPVKNRVGGAFLQKCFNRMRDFVLKLGNNLQYVAE